MINHNRGIIICKRKFLQFLILFLTVTCSVRAQENNGHGNPVKIDSNGTVHFPAMAVPQSSFLSKAGKAYVTQHLIDMQHPKRLVQHNGVPVFMEHYLARQRELYPVNEDNTRIAGVHVIIFTPKSGISSQNRNKVLINLHGGGFMGCWPGCALLESIPVSGVGHFKVVSVDYREGPKYKFPAASEDVATVYNELLKTYSPKNIGIYGCSAGGMLTGESIAWFEKHNIPLPGAIGMFCSGLTISSTGFGGDSGYLALPVGEARMPKPPQTGKDHESALPYFKGANVKGPLISVADYPNELAKFPPSLIITGTRDFAMSSAIYTHTQLVKQGVESDLEVWDGLFHGFFYNPDVPESKECYKVITRYFEQHLGRE
jgi:acetyl esterase/lipase